MKIIESQSAVLSNYEVLAHINSTLAKPRTTPLAHQNVSTVLKELKDYLAPPPDSRSPIPPYADPSSFSPQAYRALMKGLEPYGLTKSEVLMICNLRPGEQTLLDCVVEECDERFSSEQQEEILRIVRDALGIRDAEEDAVGVAVEGVGDWEIVEEKGNGVAEIEGDGENGG